MVDVTVTPNYVIHVSHLSIGRKKNIILRLKAAHI